MATAVVRNVEQAVTLATTVTQLTGVSQPAPKTITILDSDVDVYVVVLGTATDGGALPSTGRHIFKTTVLPVTFDIRPYSFVGLAGASAGTCRVEVR